MKKPGRPPNAAHISNSIWKTVNQETFYRKIQELKESGHIPEPRSYNKHVDPAGIRNPSAITVDVERCLADDLAFIAAFEPGPPYVAAVAIEINHKPPSLLFRVACNEGVSQKVKSAFDALFKRLRALASNTDALGFEAVLYQRGHEDVLDIIVQLDRNKILWRLGSAQFKPPQSQKDVRTKQSHLPRIFRLLLGKGPPKVTQKSWHMLQQQVLDLEAAYSTLTAQSADIRPKNLKRVVRCAYQLAPRANALFDRLKAVGFPARVYDSAEVRDISKIANYHKVARDFWVCAKIYKRYFSNARWEATSPYPRPKKFGIPRTVHAEMQLIVHYELNQSPPRPRVLGVSKWACFLCDSFISAHGEFRITGAHRHVLPDWMVPDLVEYPTQTVVRFRQVLKVMSRDIDRETVLAKQRPRRNVPAQSVLDVTATCFATPTPTIVFPQRIEEEPVEVPVPTRASTEQTNAPTLVQGPDHEPEREDAFDRTLLPSQDLVGTEEPEYEEFPIQEVSNSVSQDYSPWLRVYASGQATKSCIDPQSRSGTYQVTLQEPDHINSHRKIQLSDIPEDGELVLDGWTSDHGDSFKFIIEGGHRRSLQVHCSWTAA